MGYLKIVALAGAFGIGGAQSALATSITTYDRATFQTAVLAGTINEQNFDGFVAGSVLTNANGVTYSTSTGSPLVTNQFLTTTGRNGEGRTGVGYFLGSDTATFSFASPITAFGIDINTFATTPGAYTGTLNVGGSASSKVDVFPGFFTGEFLGFTSDTPFNSITVNSNTGFPYTLDTLVYGNAAAVNPSAIAEPTTLLLLGTGLLAASRRRRRNHRV